MTLFQQIDRMKYIHHLIYNRATGNPARFAGRLQLSKRQLFNILEEMRIMGLDIRYDKKSETYFYNGNIYLDISYSFKKLSNSEVKNINEGGRFFQSAILFHPAPLILHCC